MVIVKSNFSLSELRTSQSLLWAASATVDVQTDGVGTVVKALTVTDNENDVISFTMTSVPNSGSFRFDEGLSALLFIIYYVIMLPCVCE